MRAAGDVASADRFFDWSARVVLATPDGPWDARYTLEGKRDDSPWPKLQLDGLGLWLGALRRRGSTRWDEAAGCVRRWLEAHWRDPCVDSWEEREGVHGVTVWCAGDGLDSDEIRQEGIRLAGEQRVDASWLFTGAPELVRRVEQSLVSPGGGVHRHADDEYYGGGEWPLLTATLGLRLLEQGRVEDARRCRAWVEAQASPAGELPEQVPDHLLHPERRQRWLDRWGPPASPLLWSHAMHVLLCHALGNA